MSKGLFSIWAEENATLNDASYEWAFGNGSNAPNGKGVVLDRACTLVSLTACTNVAAATSVIDVQINGAQQGQVTVDGVTGTGTTADIDYDCSAGDIVGFYTDTAGGAISGPNIVTAWFEYDPDADSDESSPKDATITTRNTTSMNTGEEILEGEHETSKAVYRLNREWRPKEPAAQRFKDNVVRLLENILNNTSGGSGGGDPDPGGGGGVPGIEPDLFWDSGYIWFFCNNDNPFVLEFAHNMGQVPTRYTIFYSNAAKPVLGTDDVYVINTGKVISGDNETIGVDLTVKDKMTMRMSIAKDYLSGAGGWGIPKLKTGPNEGYIRLMVWR